MKGFLQLISLMIAFGGFAATAGVVLARGESLSSAAVRGVAAFAALLAVLTLLRLLAGLAVGTNEE